MKLATEQKPLPKLIILDKVCDKVCKKFWGFHYSQMMDNSHMTCLVDLFESPLNGVEEILLRFFK